LFFEFVGDGQHVGGRDHDDVGLEIVDDLDLPFGEAAADGDDRGAEVFAAVVGAEAALIERAIRRDQVSISFFV
jgi:hypothetical protein